jgi:hypothetical protein
MWYLVSLVVVGWFRSAAIHVLDAKTWPDDEQALPVRTKAFSVAASAERQVSD